MPIFTKEILKPGKYLARDLAGKRVNFDVTEERIDHWISSFANMKNAGLKIPAPWKHDPQANPTSDPSAKDNAGFWESLWKSPDGSLHGAVNVPLEDDAKRVGTTVQEVSPLIRPEWEDGVGTSWPDSINHIALVQKPVVPGQDNFQPLTSVKEEDKLAVAASLSDYKGIMLNEGSVSSDNDDRKKDEAASRISATSPTIETVLESLSSVGLSLPEDTTFDNLAERIVVAGKAISGNPDEEDEEDNVKDQPNPVAMAETIKTQEDELAVQKSKIDKLTALSTASSRQGIEVKLSQLNKDGKISKGYFEKRVRPLLDSYELSLDENGQPIPGELDQIVEVLEQAPSADPDAAFFNRGEILGSLVEEGKEDTFDEGNEKDIESAADQILKAGGCVTYEK